MDPAITTETILTDIKLCNGETVIDFSEFHQRIVDGDVDTVRNVLSQIPVSEKNILNCEVSYRETLSGLDGELQFKLPLFLAAASGNRDMLQVTLSHGAGVTRTDPSGNNILHSLVILSVHSPQKACLMYEHLMDDIIDRDSLQQMHRACNDVGLTPLDLAAKHCVPEILQLILNTDHVYRFQLFTEGMFTKYEYRIPLRASPTFLHMITIATKDEISRFSATSFFLNEPMRSVTAELEHKYPLKTGIINFVHGMAFAILYLVYLFLYLTTHETPPVMFSVLMMANIVFTTGSELLYQPGNTAFNLEAKTRKKMGKHPYVSINSIVISAMLYFAVTLALYIVELVGVGNYTVRSALYSIAAPLSVSWILMFVAYFPNFTHLILMIEKMLWEAWRILLLMLFMCMLFTLCLYVLAVTPSETNGRTPANITQDYLQGKFSLTLYETFLLTFAGRTPVDIFFTESSVPIISILVYVISILDGAVLLLNMLIAIFSHQVDDEYRYQHEIKVIMKLSFILNYRQRKLTNRIILARMKRNKTNDIGTEKLVFTTLQRRITSQ